MSNVVKRSLSGLLFLSVMLAGLLINQYCYAALLTFMMVTMLYEFYRMTLGDRFRRSRILAIITGVLAFGANFVYMAYHVPLVPFVILPFLLVMVSTLYERDKADYRLVSHLFMGIIYICVPLALSNLIVFDPEGRFSGLRMLAFFIIIWASDVGAYCAGMLFGQKGGRKLFPSISPQKSWAGFWGGFVLALGTAAILRITCLLAYPTGHCLLLAAVMNVAGVYGDLFESQWKRACSVKDSGRIIPGHGGMLDRFDSAIFAIPAGALYLLLTGLL